MKHTRRDVNVWVLFFLNFFPASAVILACFLLVWLCHIPSLIIRPTTPPPPSLPPWLPLCRLKRLRLPCLPKNVQGTCLDIDCIPHAHLLYLFFDSFNSRRVSPNFTRYQDLMQGVMHHNPLEQPTVTTRDEFYYLQYYIQLVSLFPILCCFGFFLFSLSPSSGIACRAAAAGDRAIWQLGKEKKKKKTSKGRDSLAGIQFG